MRSGLGLRFVRELEQGKETVRLDKSKSGIGNVRKKKLYQGKKRRNNRWSQNIEEVMYIFKIILPESLLETEEGYIFSYDKEYLSKRGCSSSQLTLPLRDEPYGDNVIFYPLMD